jgi:hypothetical protein
LRFSAGVRCAFFCSSRLPLSLLPLSPMSVFSVHEFGGRRTVDPKSLPRSHTLVDKIFGRRSRPFLICPLMIADFNFHHTTGPTRSPALHKSHRHNVGQERTGGNAVNDPAGMNDVYITHDHTQHTSDGFACVGELVAGVESVLEP